MKARKFFMVAIALLMGTQTFVWAQDKPKGKPERKPMSMEQMQAMQCNRIIGELALDDATAAKFESVYKEYMNALREAQGIVPRPQGDEPMPPSAAPEEDAVKPLPTDEEVEKAIKDGFSRDRKVLDVREKYYDEFRKFLSPKQIQKVYSMEHPRNDGKFHRRMNDGKRKAGPEPEAGKQD